MKDSRVFIALEIPLDAKEYIRSLLSEIDKSGKIKWEPAGKFHITLKFLGEIPEAKINEVKNLLSEFTAGISQFGMTFNRLGGFKRNGEYKILWAGFEDNSELNETVEKLDDSLNKIGFERETRRFKPHVTLKRLKGNEDKIVLEKFFTIKFKPYEFSADTVSFFRSILKPTGSVYKAIEKYKLGDKNG